MLTFDQIKELVELVGRNRLHGFELERSGFKLKISGENASPSGRETVVVAAPVASPAAPAPGTAASLPVAGAEIGDASATAPAAASGPALDLHVVSSPIVGTFYSAPGPDAPPFVRIGDRVRKGQVLCIVEAMKLMNEIESDVDGVVSEIYPKNAQPIEYGEPLFGLRRD